MKAIVFHSLSKNQRSRKLAEAIAGDHYEIIPVKKPPRTFFVQLFVYGYKTVADKPVAIEPIAIDFDKYDEIVLVSPVWAGRVNAFMRQFLREYPFKNKKVSIIASCDGGYERYFASFTGLLDPTNEIDDKQVYVKGIKADI